MSCLNFILSMEELHGLKMAKGIFGRIQQMRKALGPEGGIFGRLVLGQYLEGQNTCWLVVWLCLLQGE